MNIGIILTAWFLIAVVTVAALLGSGIISIKIEKIDDEEDEDKCDKKKK